MCNFPPGCKIQHWISSSLDSYVRKILGMTRAGREKIYDEKVVIACGSAPREITVDNNKPSVVWQIIFMCILSEFLTSVFVNHKLISSTNPTIKLFEKIIQSKKL